MIELTQGAQGRLDDYLCEMRQALSGSASVDPVEVERDVRDHIDEALAGHVGPVEASALDDVLRTLGSPAQWLPPERESASFRKFSAELLSPFKEAVFEIGRRLTGGPECYRLAYLSLLLLVAGFCLFPLLDAHRDLGFLPILAIIVSFVFARAALSLFGASADGRSEMVALSQPMDRLRSGRGVDLDWAGHNRWCVCYQKRQRVQPGTRRLGQ